jgi:phage-related protein
LRWLDCSPQSRLDDGAAATANVKVDLLELRRRQPMRRFIEIGQRERIDLTRKLNEPHAIGQHSREKDRDHCNEQDDEAPAQQASGPYHIGALVLGDRRPHDESIAPLLSGAIAALDRLYFLKYIHIRLDKQTQMLPAFFYETSAGSVPVLEWLRSLEGSDRRRLGLDLLRVQQNWPVCKPLGSGFWEVRSSLSGGRIARLIFCVKNGEIYVLHGFMKKTEKTPQQELALSRRRMNEVLK